MVEAVPGQALAEEGWDSDQEQEVEVEDSDQGLRAVAAAEPVQADPARAEEEAAAPDREQEGAEGGLGPEPVAEAEGLGRAAQSEAAAGLDPEREAEEAAPDRGRGVVEEEEDSGREQGAAVEGPDQAGRMGAEEAVLGSCPCPAGLLAPDQDWCPGRQEARPGRRHHRRLCHRPR